MRLWCWAFLFLFLVASQITQPNVELDFFFSPTWNEIIMKRTCAFVRVDI